MVQQQHNAYLIPGAGTRCRWWAQWSPSCAGDAAWPDCPPRRSSSCRHPPRQGNMPSRMHQGI